MILLEVLSVLFFHFVGVILLFETLFKEKNLNQVMMFLPINNLIIPFELLNFHKENVKAFKTYTITR